MNLPLSPTDIKLDLFDLLNICLYRDLPTNDPLETWFGFESYLWYTLVLLVQLIYTLFVKPTWKPPNQFNYCTRLWPAAVEGQSTW